MKFFIILASLLLSSFAPKKWKPEEREAFLKDCKNLGNSRLYCTCFSSFLEESASPEKMLEVLQSDSLIKNEAHLECEFNNKNHESNQ